ncbi:kinase-like domain-containing protein [Rhizophagus clarus]|uniref:Kinase-like domain-containing protein n=1 Tax=Rhizophagus clarus TaxID=94130 RepID=A0A8H3KSJ8_9GLOM|nr:kinase-like domain-containing protein [Rhizophagus clarus]
MVNIENSSTNKNDEWIEEAIANHYFKFYDFKNFKNIKKVGSGGFGKVFRANWKNSEQILALKSFFVLNDVTIEAIKRELILQREVDFHNNVIRFFGITKCGSVMEYADSGTLQDYLKNNFNNLTWKHKLDIAHQLACAISCLHNERIVHRDLHSGNILVHQGIIKLADFGLSKRIEETSNGKQYSKLYGIIPYVDPKRMAEQNYKLNEMSDVYSIGVLLWEISSGQRPFKNISYDIALINKIGKGSRENPIHGTPNAYVNLYTKCWDGDPASRPIISEVIDQLKEIISSIDEISENDLYNNIVHESYESHESQSTIDENSNASTIGLSRLITNEIKEYFEQEIKKVVDKLIIFIFNEEKELEESIIYNQCKIHDIEPKEILEWLLDNQYDSNHIFLLGVFNYLGIGTNVNKKKSIELYERASNYEHSVAQYYLACIYKEGKHIYRDNQKILQLLENSAEGGYLNGINMLGECHYFGIGTSVNKEKAFELFEEAANLGHHAAQYKLAKMYRNGDGVEEDDDKVFELAKKSAEGKNLDGIYMYGFCYSEGIGTNVDKEKAFELFKEASNLGHKLAKGSLAILYENGEGTEQNFDKAAELYKEIYNEGWSNLFCAIVDCSNFDNAKKDEIKKKVREKSIKLINTFVDGMDKHDKLTFHEYLALFSKPMYMINPTKAVAENYKTGEGIVRNILNVYYRSADEIKKFKN